MASEPDIVNLTKEDQKDLSDYILFCLKKMKANELEFYNNKLKDDYNSIFTGLVTYDIKSIANNEKQELTKDEITKRLSMLTTIRLTKFLNITQKDISQLMYYINELKLDRTFRSQMGKSYTNFRRYEFIFAVLAAEQRESATIEDKKDFEYYISLQILNTPSDKLNSVFGSVKQNNYLLALAALAMEKIKDLKEAVKKNEVIIITIKSLYFFSWQFTSHSWSLVLLKTIRIC